MVRPWLFDLGAFLYGIMTAQETWRSSCARLANYSPCSRTPGCRVLDLGCGPGVSTIILAHSLPDARMTGLDLAPRMLDEARHYTQRAGLDGSINYVMADAVRLPFRSDAWDMVTGHSFLYLVNDRRTVLAEALRVLHPSGRIASMEPHGGKVSLRALFRHWRNWRYVVSVLLWRPYSRLLHTQFTSESFSQALRETGFEDPVTELVLDGYGIIGSGSKP